MEFQPLHMLVSGAELFLNVFTGRFMIWGGPGLQAGGRKEGSLCGCSCCESLLAGGGLAPVEQNRGPEPAHPGLGLGSGPRTGLLPIGMLLIGNRWSPESWASRTRQAGGHTHTLTHANTHTNKHASLHTHTHTMQTRCHKHTLKRLTHTHLHTHCPWPRCGGQTPSSSSSDPLNPLARLTPGPRALWLVTQRLPREHWRGSRQGVSRASVVPRG